MSRFYVTTPIYYVNDRPHIGHVYTTTVADIVARYRRLRGDDVFFLTGTDEHAAKVVDSAAERGLTPLQWADRNADAFQDTFQRLRFTHNDFIRTSQDRHKQKVTAYVRKLLDSGDVYAGDYEGWYDAGQEEYVPENKAQEYEFKSPINGKPLVRKKEKNYFFRLGRYTDAIVKWVEAGGVRPEARANEVLGRIREGLNDVPISRTGQRDWGIPVPGDPEQTIYVWIDALFNYLSTVDTPDRRPYWNDAPVVHLIAKDILWFHAVIWPALLTALGEPLPKLVYAHSFWIAEGRKMSKSLGNFIDLEKIDRYVETFGLDALRYFLATEGPLGTTDADFAEAKFIETYNTDLANTLGNCASRVANMIGKYFDGKVPPHGEHVPASEQHSRAAERAVEKSAAAAESLQLDDAAQAALDLIRDIDVYIEQTRPFTLAKDSANMPQVGTILYNCAEALRIASVLLWPVIPGKVEELWRRMGCGHYAEALANNGRGDLDAWVKWGAASGGLQPGTPILKGDALFPRYQPT
jgi:methionyl-tRNA synthetase